MRPLTMLHLALALSPLAAGADALTPAEQTVFRQHVAEMLDRGFVRGRSALPTAQRHRRAAARVAPDDPRVDYAWGLVLLRQHQHGEATEQFRQATARPGTPYWPAWQALVWCRLTAGDTAEGLESLVEFAERLHGAAATDLVTRRELAQWMGCVVQALDQTVTSSPFNKTLAARDARLVRLFDADLRAAYEHGKQAVRDRHRQWEGELAEVRQETVAAQTQEKQDAQAQIETDRKSVAQTQETVVQTAEQWKQWLDEQSGRCDDRLQALQKEMTFLQNRLASIQGSMLRLTQEMTATRAISIDPNRRRRTPNLPAIQAQQERQMRGYEAESTMTTARMALVAQQAAAVETQRQAAAVRYRAATGQLVQRNQTLHHKAALLERKEERLETQPLDRSPQLATLERRARSLTTYVDLDPEAERVRLVKSLAQ